jgi:hypothetical protein
MQHSWVPAANRRADAKKHIPKTGAANCKHVRYQKTAAHRIACRIVEQHQSKFISVAGIAGGIL